MPLVNKTFSDIITFTRASTGTYFDSAGVLTSAATNAPRFDYDPSTLAAQGLLIEESRTNSIRNNTMQGAVAGTPGTLPTNWLITTAAGLTTNIIGTGTESGVAYVDVQITGTPTGTAYTFFFESVLQIAALNAQTWSSSLWCKIAAGTTTNITSINNNITYRDSGGASVQSARTAMSLSSTWTRYAQAGTASSASTAFVHSGLWLTVTVGLAIDITLRIGLPQLELGAFATSVIPTTTTALTRSADVASVNTLSPWYNATEGTLFAEYIATNSAQNNSAASLSDNTNDNRMLIRATNSSAQTVFIGVASTVTQWNDIIATALLNTPTKSAFGYATNDIAWVRNGGTVGTDTTATIPTVNRLQLGLDGAGTLPLNGYLRRITYYPRKLSSAELQAITA